MGQAKLIEALIEDFDAHQKKLAGLSDAELLEVAEGLAEETRGSWSSFVSKTFYVVPDEIAGRGAAMVPLLKKRAAKLAADPKSNPDLGLLLVGPLARLLAASGQQLDPAMDELFARIVERRPFDVARWLGGIPFERRLPIVKRVLIANQGRSAMPNPLLALCPAPEVIEWTYRTVAAWKRDREEMKKRWACDELVQSARSFSASAEALELSVGWLRSTDLGPYRWPFVRGLASASDPALAAEVLVAELAGKPEVARAAEEALRELGERAPEAVASALSLAEKGKSAKLKAAASRIRETLPGSSGNHPASQAGETPLERLARLEATLPKGRAEAVVEFYQKADYQKPFPWESLKADEPALLAGLMAWCRRFFPIQLAIGTGPWLERRWRDPFRFLGRAGGELAELAPWAAADSFAHIKKAEVAGSLLPLYVEAFGDEAHEPLARLVRDEKPAGRQHLLGHLAFVARGNYLDLFLEGAADKAHPVREVCAPVVAGLGTGEVPALEALLGSKKKAVREGARAALDRLGVKAR